MTDRSLFGEINTQFQDILPPFRLRQLAGITFHTVLLGWSQNRERPRLTDWHFNLDIFLRHGFEKQEAQRTVFLRDDVQEADDRPFVFSIVPAEQLVEAEALLQAEPRADPLSDPLHPQVVVDHVSSNVQRITAIR